MNPRLILSCCFAPRLSVPPPHWRRTRAASMQSRCRRWPIPTILNSAPRSCSAASSCRQRCRRARSASTPRAASRAPSHCRSTARLAGDAAVAQPQLGHPAALASGAAGGRRARTGWPGYLSETCRSRAAVRCSPAMPAIRSGSTPISGSRRCLPPIDAQGARGNDRGHDGALLDRLDIDPVVSGRRTISR